MKKQEKQDREEKQKELMEKLEEGIKAVFTSERYAEYLKLMGKFHSYSFNNTILIQMQIPNASYLAGYKTWETLERHVKKGERGIMILAPNQYKRMKEVEVFDPITGKQKVDADGNPVTEQKEITYATFRPIAIFDISQTEGNDSRGGRRAGPPPKQGSEAVRLFFPRNGCALVQFRSGAGRRTGRPAVPVGK